MEAEKRKLDTVWVFCFKNGKQAYTTDAEEAATASAQLEEGDSVHEYAAIKPAAVILQNLSGQIYLTDPEGEHFDPTQLVGETLYVVAPCV